MITFVGFLQWRAGSVEPPDGNCELSNELSPRVVQVQIAYVAGTL